MIDLCFIKNEGGDGMRMQKRILKLFLGVVLLLGLPGAAYAKPEKKVIDYVVFGDSLAAGQTPFHQIDSGYGEYLVDRFEQSQYTVGFTNYGVPGYTSEQLKMLVLTNPQAQKSIQEAEVITVDIGANDLLIALKNPATIGSAFASVYGNLEAVLRTIDQLNPEASVYVMGYYNPFPYYPEEQQASLIPLLHTLNQTIEARAAANGDTFVPTESIIEKNYEQYLPNPSDIHLSLEGYEAVAKEFWKAIVKNQ